jgi:hypothetical protein
MMSRMVKEMWDDGEYLMAILVGGAMATAAVWLLFAWCCLVFGLVLSIRLALTGVGG